ncbi:MAG: cytochrome C [Deltaproteobacteria bacterium]|nr:cytochrome C [Deltaproteobacteria bacterium]
MRRAAGRCLPPLAAVALCLAASPALAFHGGGAGECDGCHSMHDSNDGVSGPGPRGGYLLKASDPSSVCLNCHQAQGDIGPVGYHISTAEADMPPGLPPRQMAPGGDFGWLKKTFQWTTRPGTPLQTSPGERHGHSIVALDYGYSSDSRSFTAPGGTYPSANLSCVSCHDPHGKYRRFADGSVGTSGLTVLGSGSQASGTDPVAGVGAAGVYRMLGGVGYQPRSLSGALAFQNPPPAAVAPNTYNRRETTTQTRVAYGRDMSEWCANCHPRLLVSGVTEQMSGLRHPAGNGAILGATMSRNYASYLRTGKLTGFASQSYLSLVPFEEGHADYTRLKAHARSDDLYLQGPDDVSTVMCLTCHRAHASGFDGALRFRARGAEFITVGDTVSGARYPDPLAEPAVAEGRTQAETRASYYDRPATVFSPFQRSLCNKCHVKD